MTTKKLLLADIRHYKRAINKDMMGGYGTGSKFVSGKLAFLTRFLEYYKSRSVFLPNLTLAYIAAIFNDQNWKTYFTTNIYEKNKGYDLIIFYGSIPEFRNELYFAKRIKKQNPKSRVGAVGTLPTVKPEFYLDNVDFVIKGEAEFKLLKINIDKFDFSGLIEINTNNGSENIEDLPLPYWEPFLKKVKFYHSPLLGRKPMLSIHASRGCPMSCAYYCPYPLQQGSKIRLRKTENIIKELKNNIKRYKIYRYLFRDPNFGLNKKHLINLLKQIIKNKLNIKWASEMHLRSLNENIIKLMKMSGCSAITVGIESVNRNVLKNSKRVNLSNQKMEGNLKLLEKYKIKVMGGYILGNLTDTKQTLYDTFAYAKHLNTSYAQFTISTPYFGTKYFEEIKNKINTKNIEDFCAYSLTFKHENFTAEELDSLKSSFFRRYYFRIPWLIKFLKELVC